MSRVFITGSAAGLGLLAGEILAGEGHEVTLHARTDRRADDARRALPAAKAVVTGDLSTIGGMRQVAAAANATSGSARFTPPPAMPPSRTSSSTTAPP